MSENIRDEKKLDPRVRRTRRWLQQALIALLQEKNFESITVQDIAERADVNRVTFYAHFADKYALLEDTLRTLFREKLHSALPDGAAYSTENLAALIRLVGEYIAEMHGHCPPPHGNMDTLMEKQIKAELYETLRSWLPDRPARRGAKQPTPEQAATIASWAMYGAALHWGLKARREPVDEFVEQVLPLIEASLRPLALPAKN